VPSTLKIRAGRVQPISASAPFSSVSGAAARRGNFAEILAALWLERGAVIWPAGTLTISNRPRAGQLLDLVLGLTDHDGDIVLWQGDRVVCIVKHPDCRCIWI
jgi:hypothetical protein